MQIDPDSSGDGVILKPIPCALLKKQAPLRKNHFFTYYYKNSSEFSHVLAELKRLAVKGKVQSEICPTTKRGHLQGMVWCKTKCRDTVFKTLKGAHFEKIADDDDTANYCNKDETHDGLFRACWGFPEPSYVEEIENLYDWELDILALLDTEPDKRTLHWFWEPNGCAGKTTFQKYIYSHREDVVVLSGKAADMKNGIVNYLETNKRAPRIVLINIPKCSASFVSYTGLEEIKDMFFFSGKYEGGMLCGKCPHVLLFANEPPDVSKMSSDRFQTKQLNASKPEDEVDIEIL